MSYGKHQSVPQATRSQAQELTRQALRRQPAAEGFGNIAAGADARPRRESLGFADAGPINPYVRISGTAAPMPSETKPLEMTQ